MPPAAPAPALAGREIAVKIPYGPAALELRWRAAPAGRFDHDRRLWILQPEEAQALTGAVLRRLAYLLEQFPTISSSHTGKRRRARAEADELDLLIDALARDRRLWTAELVEQLRQLRADLAEHRAGTTDRTRLV